MIRLFRPWGVAAGLMAGAGLLAMSLTAQDTEAPATPQERLATLAQRAQAEPRPDLLFEIGRLQFDAGDPAAAFSALAQAVVLAPQGHHVHSYFLHQLDKSAYKGRVALLESLHKTLPDYPPLLERLAVLYQGQGKNAEAEALFKHWLSLRPDNSGPHARLAEFYRLTKRLKLAVTHLQRVREITGESAYALRRLGVIYRELGELTLSAEALSTAADLVEANDDLAALVELGHTQMAQGQGAEAAIAFETVVALDPGSPAYRLWLAQAQVVAGQSKAAQASFEATIRLDRVNLGAQLGLGKLLLSMGQPKAALAHLREASARNDRDPDMHFLVGDVALQAGDLATAEREYAKLKQIRSTTLAKKLKALIATHKGGE